MCHFTATVGKDKPFRMQYFSLVSLLVIASMMAGIATGDIKHMIIIDNFPLRPPAGGL